MHPIVKDFNEKPSNALLSSLGSSTLKSMNIKIDGYLYDKLGIKADDAGVNGGWFYWPINFDPIWLKRCEGFAKK